MLWYDMAGVQRACRVFLMLDFPAALRAGAPDFSLPNPARPAMPAVPYRRLLQARSVYSSPLGPLHLGATAEGLAGAWFEPQKYFSVDELDGVPVAPEHPVLKQAALALDRYFAGKELQNPPLTFVEGSPFQQRVWHALVGIPQGHTSTYGALANALGCPGGARAIGMAVSRNPVSLFVPCHRVVGAGQQLTGYAGGLDRKIALLELEHALVPEPEQDLFPQ